MSTSVPTRPRPPVDADSGNGSRGGNGAGGGNGWGRRQPPETFRLGMFFALSAVGMLFVALTSAYVVRLGTGGQPGRLPAPFLLWVNSVVLLVSSATFELARRNEGGGAAIGRRWIQVTLLLGLVFLAGQLLVWRMLAAQGIYLATSPSSSFFYVLTALHGLHLSAGLVALAYVAYLVGPVQRARRAADATALYWHFMDGLWIYVVLLLFVWR